MSENRLVQRFQKLKQKGEAGLLCYIVAGYPSIQAASRIVDAVVRGGADAIEIGIPFSDPIADGPSIQKASTSVLAKGMSPDRALEFASSIRKRYSGIPLVGMTYYNILLSNTVEHFLCSARKSGMDAFIIPDLPIEEANEYLQACNRECLATVFLVSPNTGSHRLEAISSKTTGFLYLVSVYGITGARQSFESYSLESVRTTKANVNGKVPVAVGFGISTPSHVKLMRKAGADAVIIGSSIVDKIAQCENKKDLFLDLEEYIRSMKEACRK